MSTNLLNIIDVASPCTVSWETMEGGEIVRFCSQCQLNVYNLSEMPTAAAEAFLKEQLPKGRTCVRFYRRHDGTILTRDCPVGLAAVRAKVKRAVLGALTVAASLFAAVFSGCSRSTEAGNQNPIATMEQWTSPELAQEPFKVQPLMQPEYEIVTGYVCLPPPIIDESAVTLSFPKNLRLPPK